MIRVKFQCIVASTKAGASGILESIKKAVQSGFGIPLSELGVKIVTMGTDSTSVMIGCKNGVVTRIRDTVVLSVSLVGILCYAIFTLACSLVCSKVTRPSETFATMCTLEMFRFSVT